MRSKTLLTTVTLNVSSTVDEDELDMDWAKIFSPDLFIEDMLMRGEIDEEELSDPYGMMVTKLCHNSVAWMYKRVLEDYPDLLDQLFLVTGSYTHGSVRMDHSWVEDCGGIILDLTASQFRHTKDRLWVGDEHIGYTEQARASFGDYEGIKQLILSF